MTANSFTDVELVDLLNSGDENAFTEIYDRYWKLLFKTAYNILHDFASAQDITQNIFINLWERRNEAKILSLKSYLQQATRFAVFRAIKDQQTFKAFYEHLADVTADIIMDDPLIFKEQQELLNNIINALPEDCQETFRLSREVNMTYKQIAASLGISEKTVEKRMSKSLKHIRKGMSLGICIVIFSINQ